MEVGHFLKMAGVCGDDLSPGLSSQNKEESRKSEIEVGVLRNYFQLTCFCWGT